MATKRKKNPDGYYVINRKVEPYKDKNGKIQVYKKFYGKTVQEAKDKYDKYISGEDSAYETLFFGDAVEEFIQSSFLPNPKYKEGTKQRYIDAYHNNLSDAKLAGRKLTSVTYRDLQKAYAEMTCKPSSITSCHKLLRLFFSLMVKQGVVDRDPTEGLVVPKPEKRNAEVVTFTDDEIQRIRKHIVRTDLPFYQQRRLNRTRLFISIAMNTGMRTSEILALTYNDISDVVMVNKQVVLKPIFEDGKTSGHELAVDTVKSEDSVRSIPVNQALKDMLEIHRKWHKDEMKSNGYTTDYIFTTSSGKLYDKRSIRHTIDKVHNDCGVPECGLHTYRRTFGTQMARKHTPIHVLAKLMGHSDIKVTAKYYLGISEAEKADAVADLYD